MAETGAETLITVLNESSTTVERPEVVDKTYFSFDLRPQRSIEGPQQQNYDLLRQSFLRTDSQGKHSTTGGICTEAFQKTLTNCGDPSKWTQEDMKRQEIQDVTTAYRAFGALASNQPLVPEEKSILEKLTTAQIEIDRQNGKQLSDELKRMQEAFATGVKEETAHRDKFGIKLQWSNPEEMGPGLTSSIWKVYEGSLGTTQKEREEMLKSSLKLSSQSSKVEPLGIQHLLEELRRLMQKRQEEEARKNKEAQDKKIE